jgi:electron transport complex protein RnfG
MSQQVSTKEIFKITVNLILIYLAGGFILAAVYAKTSPIIFLKNKEEKKQALRAMIPGTEIDLEKDKLTDWSPHGKHGEVYQVRQGDVVVGYIVQSFGKGYSSYIDTLVAVNKEMTVQKIDILHHGETPGLGDEIERERWQKQFAGKTVETLKVDKSGNPDTPYVQAISGATISSRAVTEDAVQKGVVFLKKYLAGEDISGHGEEGH